MFIHVDDEAYVHLSDLTYNLVRRLSYKADQVISATRFVESREVHIVTASIARAHRRLGPDEKCQYVDKNVL